MRALLLCFSVAVLSVYALSDEDACHFIGARFLRNPSTCVAGACEGVHRLSSERFVRWPEGARPASCSEARLTFLDFLKRDDGIRRPLLKPFALRIALRADVVPALELLAFGSEKVGDLAAVLRDFDAAATGLIAQHIKEWGSARVPEFFQSTELDTALRRVYRLVLFQTQQRALAHGSLQQLSLMALQFLFDMSALFGPRLLSHDSLAAASLLVQNSRPRYRPVGRWETDTGPAWEGVPMSASAIVAVSSAAERLSQWTSETSKSDVGLLTQVLRGWHACGPSSTKFLLGDQFANSICPNLVEVVFKLFTNNHSQLAIGFVDLCGYYSTFASRRHARDMITNWLSRGAPAVDRHGNISATDFLKQRNVTWSMGLAVPHGQPDQFRVTRTLLFDFTTSNIDWVKTSRGRFIRFVDDEDPVELALAFGRALGLAILHGVGLQGLELNHHLAIYLHPRWRLVVGNLDQVQSVIAPTTIDDLLHISAGLGEVLGPGGFEMYSNDQWSYLMTSTAV